MSQSQWEPYVVRQGDTLRLLAYRARVSADTIWSSPKNADLKARRKNEDILLPTDIIYLPQPKALMPLHLVILRVGHLDPINSESGVAQRLINIGYPATTDDEGHSSRRAIALFQNSQGLTPTGELDSNTQDALEKAHGL